MSIDKKKFWDDKIIGWEVGRYDLKDSDGKLLETSANRLSRSLRFRIYLAREVIAPICRGKRILELGCGSARLMPDFMAAGAASYHGVDISTTAIKQAQERAEAGGYGDAVTLTTGGIDAAAGQDSDIVLSLGLLDWLTDEELRNLFDLSRSAMFFHAIAEKRLSLSQYLHRAYVHLSYGYRSQGYVPRYYSVAEMEALSGLNAAGGQLKFYRDPRLSFGAIAHNLPEITRPA
ncbi:MAG: class I SAM-dependent methyltransferase [Rhodospirillales bacterium]